MECYSITLHKTSVQFLYLKKGAKHQPQKSEWKYLFSFLKSTSMAHAPHTVHKLTFKSPTEDMIAGTRENSIPIPSVLSLKGWFLQEPLLTCTLSQELPSPDNYTLKKANKAAKNYCSKKCPSHRRLRSKPSLGYLSSFP